MESRVYFKTGGSIQGEIANFQQLLNVFGFNYLRI